MIAGSPQPSEKPKRRTLLWACLLPVITLLLGFGVAAIILAGRPPTYLSTARIVDPGRPDLIRKLGVEVISPASLADMMQSACFRQLAWDHLKSSKPEFRVPRGPDGQPLPVEIILRSRTNSSVYDVTVIGSDPDYVGAFLDALVTAAIDYVNNMNEQVSGDVLASLTELTARVEREMIGQENSRLDFARTNKPAVLQAESAAAVDCVKQLSVRLADLELEKRFLKCSGPDQDTTQARVLDQKIMVTESLIREWESRLQENSETMSAFEGMQRRAELVRVPYERLARMLQDATLQRNLSRGTLRVLEPASEAKRSHATARHLFGVAGLSGFGTGLGMVLLVGGYRLLARRKLSCGLSDQAECIE